MNFLAEDDDVLIEIFAHLFTEEYGLFRVNWDVDEYIPSICGETSLQDDPVFTDLFRD